MVKAASLADLILSNACSVVSMAVGLAVPPRRVPARRDADILRPCERRMAGVEWNESIVQDVRVTITRRLTESDSNDLCRAII